jgi:hypothetical protein
MYKLADIASNRVTMHTYELLKKEKLARENCDWLYTISRNWDKVYDVGENCFFFCPKCFILTVRDIEMFEVIKLIFIYYLATSENLSSRVYSSPLKSFCD